MQYRILFVYFIFNNLQLHAKVDTLYVKSSAMNCSLPNLIVLPHSPYTEPLPVIYLLHGAGGDFGNWMRRVPVIEELAEEFGVIVVCPDGGKQGWYLDSPELENSQYESYVVHDLIPTIDSLYNTRETSTYRAITGLSMGGHGALYLALRHPELFRSAGSMSGGVDLRPFSEHWGLPKLLGSIDEYPERWAEHSVVEIARRVSTSTSLIFDCGLSDFFLEVNRDLDNVLNERGILHSYSEREGTHNWNYWRVSVVEHFRFFAARFAGEI